MQSFGIARPAARVAATWYFATNHQLGVYQRCVILNLSTIISISFGLYRPGLDKGISIHEDWAEHAGSAVMISL